MLAAVRSLRCGTRFSSLNRHSALRVLGVQHCSSLQQHPLPHLSKNQIRRQARQARKAAKRGVAPPEWPHVKSLGNPSRYCAVISFDGSQYHGWQKQHPPGAAPLRTVQGVIEEATRRALQQHVRVHASGRCGRSLLLLR
jgi:hypothetical protein